MVRALAVYMPASAASPLLTALDAAQAGRRTPKCAGWRAWAAVGVLVTTLLQGTSATCPTFVAWLDSNKNVHNQAVS